MAYGKIKADKIVYDNGTSDVEVNVSALAGAGSTAPTNSPAFTGTPTAPTAAQSTNTTQIATTEFVQGQLVGPAFTGTPTAPTAAQGTNTTQIATTEFVNAEIAADITGKADIASPTFTGTPAAPTAAQGANTTQIATTAYVQGEVGSSIQAYDALTAKTNANITWDNAQRGVITVLTSATTITPDYNASNNWTCTLNHNATIANPTNLTAGQSGSIFLVQDGTGSRTVSWGSYWDFAGGTAPTLTTTASAVDRIDYVVRSSTSIHAVVTLDYS